MEKPDIGKLRQYLWPAANGLLALVLLGLVVAYYSQGDRLSERAYNQGRRAVIDVRTGAVSGHFSTSPPVPQSKKDAPPTQEDTQPEASHPASELDETSTADGKEQDQPHRTAETQADATPINNAMPGNFVGQKLESQQTNTQKDTKPVYDYPEKVKQEPQTRRTADAAPTKGVHMRDLENAGSGQPLPEAPLEDLQDEISEGVHIPRINANGLRPWQAYRKPFEDSSSQPIIAIVISGLGLNNATQNAFRLEEHFTFSLSPYGKEAAMWANQARNSGHEILADLPMQTQDYPATDPGPDGLLTTLKPEENKERLHRVMAKFPGYVGLFSTPGAAIPAGIVQNALSDIGARGLLLLEMPADASAQLTPTQREKIGLLSLTADKLLDADLNETRIQAKLVELVLLAKKKGYAVGVAHPYPLTLQILQQWQKTLEGQGVRLAPLSAIAERIQ